MTHFMSGIDARDYRRSASVLSRAMIFASMLLVMGLVCINNALAQTSSQFNPQYPPRATAVAAVFSGANNSGSATASIPASPGQTSYICGFTVSGLGATAGSNVTVTAGPLATAGNNFSYPYVYATGVTVLDTTLAVSYQPCIPANAQNTAIVVTVPASTGGNTSTNINVQGYQFPNP